MKLTLIGREGVKGRTSETVCRRIRTSIALWGAIFEADCIFRNSINTSNLIIVQAFSIHLSESILANLAVVSKFAGGTLLNLAIIIYLYSTVPFYIH